MWERENEREINIFSVVTGTHYGTKILPDPAGYESVCRGYDKKVKVGRYMYTG